MKLLYITNGINGAGGLERVLSIKASYLVEHYNYKVTIVSLNDGNNKPFYEFSNKISFKNISVKGNVWQYCTSYRKGLSHIVTRTNPDIIIICDDGLKAFFIPIFLSKKVPIIYERHVSKEIEMNHEYPFWKKTLIKAKWKLMESLAQRFQKFVVLTEGNTKEWKMLKNLEVIPNPLSFYPEESSALQNKKLIAVGRHAYQKGYDRLLQAWKMVHEKYPDWHLEIYGKIEANNSIKKLAQNLEIGKCVTFYPPANDIQSKYMDASIYVMSSRYEGFGMVLIEAMACGLPCVSFDCNYGPSDIIDHGHDGLLVENGNIKELAEALIKLVDNYDLRLKLGSNAKENVKRFLPETVVKKWDDLFKTIVNFD